MFLNEAVSLTFVMLEVGISEDQVICLALF